MKKVVPTILTLLEDNKSRNTKERLEEFVVSQLRIGDFTFIPSEIIIADLEAKKIYDKLIKMIIESDADFISNFDNKLLEDYCLICAEKNRLEKIKQKIMKEGKEKGKKNIEIMAYIDKLEIQKQINKLVELSLKLFKALNLDPLSRLSALRKKQEPKKDNKNKFEQQFGEI